MAAPVHDGSGRTIVHFGLGQGAGDHQRSRHPFDSWTLSGADDSGALVSKVERFQLRSEEADILLSAGCDGASISSSPGHRPTKEVLARPFSSARQLAGRGGRPVHRHLWRDRGRPTGAAWVGPTAAIIWWPQNVNVVPALGTRNVGVGRSRRPIACSHRPALTTIINDLRAEIVTGVNVVNSNGQMRSVARYYREASANQFDINLVGIAGPIRLQGPWGISSTRRR